VTKHSKEFFGDKLIVVVSEEGPVITSSDGLVWQKKLITSPFKPRAVAFGGGTFVVVGTPIYPTQKEPAIMTSADGESWAPRLAEPVYYFRGIAYGRDTFVAVGNAILQSGRLPDK
jgi:hypothetical protein